MLIKHPNVYAMTSGWAPKYVPEEIWNVQRKRNNTKLMWSSDYPILRSTGRSPRAARSTFRRSPRQLPGP